MVARAQTGSGWRGRGGLGGGEHGHQHQRQQSHRGQPLVGVHPGGGGHHDWHATKPQGQEVRQDSCVLEPAPKEGLRPKKVGGREPRVDWSLVPPSRSPRWLPPPGGGHPHTSHFTSEGTTLVSMYPIFCQYSRNLILESYLLLLYNVLQLFMTIKTTRISEKVTSNPVKAICLGLRKTLPTYIKLGAPTWLVWQGRVSSYW